MGPYLFSLVWLTVIALIQDIEAREEAGTPDIIGSIRCGLVFALVSKGFMNGSHYPRLVDTTWIFCRNRI